MKHLVLGFSILALACAVLAAPFETTCDGYCVGPVKISCPEAGNWSFTATRGTAADGVETMEIALTASRPSPPPRGGPHSRRIAGRHDRAYHLVLMKMCAFFTPIFVVKVSPSFQGAVFSC